MAKTNTNKDESSIARAPQQIMPACFKITGMATLPTADVPVKNLVASTQLFHFNGMKVSIIFTVKRITYRKKIGQTAKVSPQVVNQFHFGPLSCKSLN